MTLKYGSPKSELSFITTSEREGMKMKIKDICKQHGFDQDLFENFILKQKFDYISNFTGAMTGIDDANVSQVVSAYTESLQRAEQIKREAEELNQRKQKALAEMLITSGFSFDGYKITRYSGYISGDDAVQIPRSTPFGGNNGKNLTDALVKIRIQAIKELKEAAYDLGCNAVIGVDFDYITLEPETANLGGGTLYEPYIICVTANGNAVVIEKE